MAHRVVTDRVGTSWQVWSVSASAEASERAALAMAARYAGGWLAFEQTASPTAGSALEKRRLVPVPMDWDTASDDALLAWLASAEPVQRRILPPIDRAHPPT